jgi:hypothetical protein
VEPIARSEAAPVAAFLALLTFLFALRVTGQALVVFLGVDWLPPPDHWMSGLLSYPWLLLSQLAILVLQVKIVHDVVRRRGWGQRPRPRAGRVLRGLSYPYFGLMVVRYAVTMSLFPERRWLGSGTIPTVFHCVLALWLWCYGSYLRRA